MNPNPKFFIDPDSLQTMETTRGIAATYKVYMANEGGNPILVAAVDDMPEDIVCRVQWESFEYKKMFASAIPDKFKSDYGEDFDISSHVRDMSYEAEYRKEFRVFHKKYKNASLWTEIDGAENIYELMTRHTGLKDPLVVHGREMRRVSDEDEFVSIRMQG